MTFILQKSNLLKINTINKLEIVQIPLKFINIFNYLLKLYLVAVL